MKDKRVVVTCNQSNEEYTVKVEALSKPDTEPITMQDLVSGTQLLMDFGKHAYPVTVQKIKQGRKRGKEEAVVKLPKRSKLMETAKAMFTSVNEEQQHELSTQDEPAIQDEPTEPTTQPEPTIQHETTNQHEPTTQELLIDLNHKVDKLLEFQKANLKSPKAEILSEYTFNGIDLLSIPAKDAHAYGRALLDILFSKQEQKSSVIIKTSKSDKPPLSPRRTKKLFGSVDKIYGKNYEHKKLISTLGQKCRDAKDFKKTEE